MIKKLEVQDLKISFRTQAGQLQAVRNISFDLYEGETLAIVGESGSGKSVTSKAIMKILAGNSIVEGGKILYDGKDLLKISEEEMVRLRGDKIAMIFQDPLSSLNPIMRIGKQITEAMLLKNKVMRKVGRKEFNDMLQTLRDSMVEATGSDKENVEKIDEYIHTFDNFNIEAITLENVYNTARTAAIEIGEFIDDILFKYEKNQKVDLKATASNVLKRFKQLDDKFLLNGFTDRLESARQRLSASVSAEAKECVDSLKAVSALLSEISEAEKPNFFRIGYYKFRKGNDDFGGKTIKEINEETLKFLNEDFLDDFIALELKAVEHSFNVSLEKKKIAIEKIDEFKEIIRTGNLEKAKISEAKNVVVNAVKDSINKLLPVKDSIAYTFESSLKEEIDRYFFFEKNNPKEEKRFAKQTAKREALIARGKSIDWKVVPKSVVDLNTQIDHIIAVLDDFRKKYVDEIASAGETDFKKIAVDLIDYFKEKASLVVYKITRSIARKQAIDLMEEVGIPEPRIRYRQYPFEFSGGMRQRIVIAIALAANPDILICDEPTTALDVTIQAQILELINKLKKERRLSVIFITHDLGVVANMADRVAVMYAGKIVEYGTAEDIFYSPAHPYTWALLSSMPDLDTNEKLDAIPGTPPNMIYPPKGDAFAERNKYAMEIDFEEQPPMFKISDTHSAATWLLHPDAPKVEMPKIITERIARMNKMRGESNGKQ